MKKYKKEDDVSYTLGASLTFQLFETMPHLVRAVYLHPSMAESDTGKKIRALAAPLKVPVNVGEKALAVLSPKENCFLAAQFSKFTPEPEPDTDHIVLVNPSNAGNLGTILRSCLGFGRRDVFLIRPAVDIFDPKTVRASMGAIFGIRFRYFDSFDEYLERYGEGRALYPFILRTDRPLHETTFRHPHALIFGNEATGLPEEFQTMGEPVIIRHSHDIDSLNLPIAASIALFESTKGEF